MAYIPNIVLYSKPTCPFCRKVLAYMEEQVRDATEALGQAMASEKQAYAQLEKARDRKSVV